MTARALYRSSTVDGLAPPYNQLNLKIFYPAKPAHTDMEHATGRLAAHTNHSPFPVLIMMPGINVSMESYSWLASALAENNIVTVCYQLLVEEFPGLACISPGLDIEQLKPAHFGQQPSSTTLTTILSVLDDLQNDSVLKGLLNVDNIIVGGHSAGGTAALLNANPEWFPMIKAAFSYGAHTAAASALGWPSDHCLPINPSIPTLIIGGDQDQVIANSTHYYGIEPSTTELLIRTFEQAIHAGGEHSASHYLAIIAGANHYAITYPKDHSVGRAFLEQPQQDDLAVCEYLQQLIHHFIEATANGNEHSKKRLLELCSEREPMLTIGRTK